VILENEALRLPPKARAGIAGTRLRSLGVADDPSLEDDWVAEIGRRVAEVDAGKVKLVPWSRARRRLRAGV
jgi:putative addiction module component (TIGR02574 family)